MHGSDAFNHNNCKPRPEIHKWLFTLVPCFPGWEEKAQKNFNNAWDILSSSPQGFIGGSIHTIGLFYARNNSTYNSSAKNYNKWRSTLALTCINPSKEKRASVDIHMYSLIDGIYIYVSHGE